MKIIDISMTLGEDMPVYEGDPEFRIKQLKDLSRDGVKLSSISMGLHTGTHVDAPAHYIMNGKTIDELDLKTLTGKARVCDLTYIRDRITEADLKKHGIRRGGIILLKTQNSELLREKRFMHMFVSLAEDAADYLIRRRIKAVGIDYLSIEEFGSRTSYVHRNLLANGIQIMEGLLLDCVKAGTYTLYCLPLKVGGGESAPARCILVK
ncbi:MAG: cyclase family protein [Candidatus Altiarchaeota archaeon]|nr:cyclase family protein [Candidatus Altiarchaeota archaeon]